MDRGCGRNDRLYCPLRYGNIIYYDDMVKLRGKIIEPTWVHKSMRLYKNAYYYKFACCMSLCLYNI